VTDGAGAKRGAPRVAFSDMRRFLERTSALLHRSAEQPVTVGSATTKHLGLVRGIGLDHYQVHWYEHFGRRALEREVSRLGLDRPVVLGEFPGATKDGPVEDIVRRAQKAGYGRAYVWSYFAEDDRSRYPGRISKD
jgi:hypothetical protein